MKVTFRRAASKALLVTTAVAVSMSLASCATTTTATSEKVPLVTSAVHYWSVPAIARGRFIHPYEMDGGGLLVTPVPLGYQPRRSLASVSIQAWATSQVTSYRPDAIGLGVVTITRATHGVIGVHRLISWVAIANDGFLSWSCPAETMPSSTTLPVPLPSSGFAAIVIGDSAGSPAVAYQSRSFSCDSITPTLVSSATEVISVPWIYAHGQVSVRLPGCSSMSSESFGSTRTSTSFGYYVAQRESIGTSTFDLTTCAATRWVSLGSDREAAGVTASTEHEPVGPTRQVISG